MGGHLRLVLSQHRQSYLPYCLLDRAHQGLRSRNELAKLQGEQFYLHRQLASQRLELHPTDGRASASVWILLACHLVECGRLHFRGQGRWTVKLSRRSCSLTAIHHRHGAPPG